MAALLTPVGLAGFVGLTGLIELAGLEPSTSSLSSAQTERRKALERDFVFSIQIEDIDTTRRAASKLDRIASVPTIIDRYHQLDDQVDQLEMAVDWMLVTWDRHVQTLIDERRGK